MTETDTGDRWDAYLCQPGERPFLLGVIEAPDDTAAFESAADALAGFMPGASRDDLIVQPEGEPAPKPTPREVAELPPSPLRRVALGGVSPLQVRAVLMRFLGMLQDSPPKSLEDAGNLAFRVRSLHADLRMGELGALQLCEDLASEATALLNKADRIRREAMQEDDT